ncbi:MAG: carboxylesterase family protein [Paenarthrobacter ureafaciens]|uniref:carboxylesterase family protein n=1 Tax=Paenarthrobacter ureafaciens TaxID=37931 RepID=UPI001AC40F74|nr:carboxylesterase family protein [Paenarthrobacter ureafaciens]MBN9129210.1 carboxylesterase family protein [Paenarthrobacter ureafaciens]
MTVLLIDTQAGKVRANLSAGVVDAPGLRYSTASSRSRGSEVSSVIAGEAQARPAAFPQRPGMLDGLLGTALSELEQSEDAFALRVQAPAGAHGLPVLFFIPGGGFTTGSGECRWYDSPDLVRNGGFVLVTVNYRLGVAGHFGPSEDPSESTKPLRDLKAALAWVQENISAFGGDPGKVTLAGDSAGAWYAYAVSTDPSVRGMAAQTLLISMPRLAPLPVDVWLSHCAAVLATLGSDLAAASVPAVLDAQEAARAGLRPFPYMPAESGEVPADLVRFADSVQRIHTDALFILTTAEESAAFLRNQPRDQFSNAGVDGFLERTFKDPALASGLLGADDAYLRMVRAATLAQFRLPALEIAAHSPVPAQVVRFDHQSKLDGAYAAHCFPLAFIFDGTNRWADSPMMVDAAEAETARVTASMRDLISRFLYCGVAESSRYDAREPRSMVIDADGVGWEPVREAEVRVLG